MSIVCWAPGMAVASGSASPPSMAGAFEGIVLGLLFLLASTIVVSIIKSFLLICRPNELLIISGRSNQLADGSSQGYRVVGYGRTMRIPILETVSHMDLTIMPVDIHIHGAYSRGGIPLNVVAIGNVKVSSDPRLMHNAIERFMGRDRKEIRSVAKETLEGHLRGVLANLTPEEVNEDRLKFAEQLLRMAKDDLDKLGLQLDTLKIQSVSDDTDYLRSIGRERIAQIIMDATIAESDAENEAQRAEADFKSRADVVEANAEAITARLRNQIRRVKAELDAQIRAAEERATGAGQETRMLSEMELQTVRAELEELRLRAEVILPAEADRKAAELIAVGSAAKVREEGRAMQEVMASLARAWEKAGPSAGEMMVIRQLEAVLEQVATAVDGIEMKSVNLIDNGDGKALPAYVASYPAMVTAVLDQIRGAVGIDLTGSLVTRDTRVVDVPAASEVK